MSNQVIEWLDGYPVPQIKPIGVIWGAGFWFDKGLC